MNSSPPGSSVHGISQARIWSGLPFPSPGDFPHPGIEPMSPALSGGFSIAEPPGKPIICSGNLCCVSCPIVSNSLWPHGLQPTRLLYPYDFLGKNPMLGCHSLLQGIFLTQGLNPHLLCWQAGSLPSEPPGKAIGESNRYIIISHQACLWKECCSSYHWGESHG